MSICNFLESFINKDKGFHGKEEDKKKWLDALFAWSFAWGIGGSLEQRFKDRFDTIVRDQFKSAHIPPTFTSYDYLYDLKRSKEFKPWTSKVPAFVYDKDSSYFDLMVPTQDTTKHAYILETLLFVERPIFFTGSSGVGKSVVISNLISQMKEKGTL
jgi:dynein heavy chain